MAPSKYKASLLKYSIYEDFRDNKKLRNKFYNYVDVVFPSANFKIWHDKGFWQDEYIPFSIIKNDKIISNVSITKMKILINGVSVNGIQFGTVGTIPAHRNKGYSRILMEYVLNKFQSSTDIFLLFANDSVLNFYPKFGFENYSESIFISNTNIPKPQIGSRKLNINDSSDFTLIKKLLKSRLPLTRIFGATDYDFITFWHILNMYSNNLFYLEEDEVIVIKTEDNNRVHIWDVIFMKPLNLSSVIPKIIENHDLRSIRYYFPPDQLEFDYDEIEEDTDSPFFIRGNFDLQNSNFKFPVTAQT